ncbi:MAG: SusC/RagA family TonB-linked outer membrane protein [Flavitalea sp.]
MRKILSLLTVGIFTCALTFGQAKTVTGRVTDSQGNPVPYATVTVRGGGQGTAADQNGQFSLSVKKGDVLVISGTELKTKTITVGDSDAISVQVEASNALLEEVVVTAGGFKAKRKEIGTATTVVKAEDLVAGKAVNIAGGLQGKVAGLQINATGGGVNPNFRLVLRGQRSLTGNNQALVVLDNVIVPNEILGNLNPEDVENVTVLNGGGAAALYGSQASNGAIIITTKKGKKGVTSVTVSNTTTLQQSAFFPKFQEKFGGGGYGYGADDFGNPNFSYLENQSYGPAYDGTKRPLGSPLEDGTQDSAIYSYNPGHKKFWETGIQNQTDFSVSSGDDVSTFYVSGQYATVTGTTPGDKFNRTVLRVNGTRKIGSKVLVSYTTSYTQNRYDITSQTGSMYGNMLNMPSWVDITRYKNWKTDKFANPNGFYNPWYQNPYFTADNYRSKSRNDYLVGNIELRFTPIKGLDLVARQGLATRNYSSQGTVGEFIYTEYAKHTEASSKSDIPGSVSEGTGYTTNLLTDLYADYNKEIGDFEFRLIGGAQFNQNEGKNMGITANGLVVPDLYNVSNGVGTPSVSAAIYKARQIGAYGKTTIGYKNFLYLNGSYRNDWVSTLAPENRSFSYWAVDASVVASEVVDAIKNSDVISNLKFRGGYSKVGQVNLPGNWGAYQLRPTFSSGANGFPYGSRPGYTVDNLLVSNSLNPEITKGYEFGFDLGLFNERVSAAFTYFNTKTDDQTVTTRVSNTTGFSNLLTNTGQTQSKGIEISLNTLPVRTKDWEVAVGGNYSYLDNTVNNISADLKNLALATYGNTAGSYAVEGMAFPVIMGFDYNRDPEGRVIINQADGLPSRADTISILGNAVAKHKLGLNGNVSWKNFTFSVLFEYRGGYQAYHAMGGEMDWSGTGYRTAMYNRERFVFPNSVYWDGNKYVENTNITIKNGGGNNGFWSDGINRDVTSNYVTSGDFWKLREMSIAYDVPVSKIFGNTNVVKGMRISVQGRNLLLFMAKDNYYTDPEYSDAGNDSNGIGLTGIGQTPPARYYGGTVTFRF